jgi:hypothetical protein
VADTRQTRKQPTEIEVKVVLAAPSSTDEAALAEVVELLVRIGRDGVSA